MINLTKAIWSELSGSALSARIQDRLFEGIAEQGAPYPYVVYNVENNIPEYPGGKTIEKYSIQFSIFSSSSSSTEAKNILTDLWTLYDDKVFLITGSTPIYFIRGILFPQTEVVTTPSGTINVFHYAQDYDGWMVRD